MKRFSGKTISVFVTAVLLCIFALPSAAVPPASAQPSAAVSSASTQCTPKGPVTELPFHYDHIADGTLKYGLECWGSSFPATLVTDTLCYNLPYPTSSKAIDFPEGIHATAEQTIVVPSYLSNHDRWQLDYMLTFIDPNHDGAWNRLKVKVIRMDTYRTVAEQTFWGNNPDIRCSRRTLSFNGTFAGKTLKVIFDGDKNYPDTIIRVRGFSLYSCPANYC